jgi:hypothetical protein
VSVIGRRGYHCCECFKGEILLEAGFSCGKNDKINQKGR